nr:tetraspanin-8-like [Ipomoea batatas]
MVRVSNAIIAFLNFLTLIVAVVGIGAAVWIQFNPSATLCQKKYVVNAQNWDQIKSCLVDIRLCQHLANGKNADYYKHSLSATQESQALENRVPPTPHRQNDPDDGERRRAWLCGQRAYGKDVGL